MAVAPDNENEAYFLTAAWTQDARRRQDDHRPARRRGAGRRPPRHLDRPDQRQPHDRGPRPAASRSRINRGRTWFQPAAADRADVPRHGRQPDPLQRLRQPAGRARRTAARATAARRLGGDAASRAACGTRWAAARAAGPRPIPMDSEHRLVERLRLRQRRRHRRRASTSAPASAQQRRGLARRARSARRPRTCKYRFVWDFPLTISPHDHNTIYVGSQHVHRTTDGGQSWQVISPDLTLQRQEPAAAARAASRPTTSASSTRASSSPSPSRRRERGLIWAGTNDGLVQLTRDGGEDLDQRHGEHPGPARRGARSATSSRRATTPATAYLTVDFHQVNNRDPFVYKTTDYGKTWKLIVNGIPKSMLSYAHVDPRGPGAARAALPGHRERDLRLVRRRRALAAAAEQPAARAGVLASPCRSTSTTW